MAKQIFKLKRLLLDYAFRCIVLFTIVLCLFSKVVIAQQQITNFLPKLENSVLLQTNLAAPKSIAQASTVEVYKKTSTPSLPVEPKDKPEPNVLVAEVVVTGVEGELQDRVYETIQTKPGKISTHSLLKKDINAIFAIGYFSRVKAAPEDTPLGVRVTFKVQLNPILKSVNINSKIPPNRIIDEAFQSQYGSILNWSQLREGIKKIKEWYLDNGYVLVQFLDAPKVDDDGTVTLEVTEGVIEDVQVQFVKVINGKTFNIQNGEPIQGETPTDLILDDFGIRLGKN
jgi:outer membrane protein insertion porin family